MNNPLGVSPSKGNQGTTRGKEKIFLTLVGIEPTTSGLDLPLLCRLSYEVGQRKSGTIEVVNRGKEKVRVHINVPRSTKNTNGAVLANSHNLREASKQGLTSKFSCLSERICCVTMLSFHCSLMPCGV